MMNILILLLLQAALAAAAALPARSLEVIVPSPFELTDDPSVTEPRHLFDKANHNFQVLGLEVRQLKFLVTESCERTPGSTGDQPVARVHYQKEPDSQDWLQLDYVYEDPDFGIKEVDFGASEKLVIGPYDFNTHELRFSYKNCQWSQNQELGCGKCVSKTWSSPNSTSCNSHGHPQNHVIDCEIIIDKRVQPVEHTLQSIGRRAESPDIVTKADEVWGYYPFSVEVTEYCEGSLGTPLKAKAIWVDLNVNWFPIEFGDGRYILVISIPGYGNNKLVVGPYDYWNSQLKFSYGDCVWNQDNGQQWCGYCSSGSWSQLAPLSCSLDGAWASRNHIVNCWVAVEHHAAPGAEPRAPTTVFATAESNGNNPVV